VTDGNRAAPSARGAGVVRCVDVGSTFTKAAAVSLPAGRLLATASAATTIATDVMDGITAVLADLAAATDGSPDDGELLACSSAGGGLRLAVVGYERAVTAEAGYRVGLSAGAKVVHVASGRLDADTHAALVASAPDVVLLVGGTDGGNTEVLLHNARHLAAHGPSVPVVLAGNVDARDEVSALLTATTSAVPATRPTENVLPTIGVLDPLPARQAIRDVFIRHVIGGKHLSASPAFAAMVRSATPDAVLAGVELLAESVGDVVVVDVGGATTDVYSVLTPDPEEAELHREVVEPLWHSRTVEGDLGLRWNAAGIVTAAVAERLVDGDEAAGLAQAAALRVADPSWLPDDAEGAAVDARLAELAVTIALRRHARPQQSGEVRTRGKDLRQVRLVVGSGGVLRHGGPDVARTVLRPALTDHAGGWLVPERAATGVDQRYVLAAAGLLAVDHPDAARRLAARAVAPVPLPVAAPRS
jgi:uncharacterized protein (TIGR01319 family)